MKYSFVGALTVLLLCVSQVCAIKAKPAHEATDHPTVVLVNTSASKPRKACAHSGILIAPTVILTAAHCVHGFDAFEVVAPYAKRGALRAVTKIGHVHPDFQPGDIENDLAIIMLKDPLNVGSPFPIVHDGSLYPLDTQLQVIGRVKNGTISPSQLFEASVMLVNFPGNTNLYGGFPQTVEKGDSGGPVFLPGKEPRLVGIVIGILEFNRSNVPTDAYVPLSRKNRDWVHHYLHLKR